MKRKVSILLVLAMLVSLLSTTAFAANETRDNFALTQSVDVTVDGSADKTVDLVFSSVTPVQVMGINGSCDIAPATGITLESFTVPWTVTLINPANKETGMFAYADDEEFTGFLSAAGASLVTMTYTISKDTATGSYPVQFTLADYSNEDLFNNNFLPQVALATYTATINVTNTSGSDNPTPTDGYTVTISDGVSGTDDVEVGDTVTMNVTTNKAVNGIRAVVTYDTDLFSCTEDTGKTGKIDVTGWFATATTDIKTLTFTAEEAGTGTFGFDSTTSVFAGDYEDFRDDAVKATAVNDSVKVTVSASEPDFEEVATVANYVTGYTLVTVTGENANGYTYDGSSMIKVGTNKYAYLVYGAVTEDDAKAAVAENTSATCDDITKDTAKDVNGTGTVDFNDAGAAFGCYNMAYDVNTYMAMYLRADVNSDNKVDADDVDVILAATN